MIDNSEARQARDILDLLLRNRTKARRREYLAIAQLHATLAIVEELRAMQTPAEIANIVSNVVPIAIDQQRNKLGGNRS